MSHTFIEIHAIHSVPPSNINRDDTGSPKSAVFGGVRRARVSSQSWKRAMRDDFKNRFDANELGLRSIRLVEALAQKIALVSPELAPQANEVAAQAFSAAGLKVSKPKARKDSDSTADLPEITGYLVFLSDQQLQAVAELVVPDFVANGKVTASKKELLTRLRDKNSVDLALFGRMVADNTDLNVDASAQVSHAIGVARMDAEFDYFTAVDDVKAAGEGEEDSGAAMIGTVEFNSPTLYRYANINVTELAENLGDFSAAVAAIGKFIESFVHSMPSGKQNTFANRTLPEGVLITIRGDQPISLANAFLDPVVAVPGRSLSTDAARRLADYATELYTAYGNAPRATFVQGIGETGQALASLGTQGPLPQIIQNVQEALASELNNQ